jgi:pyruvate,water dikinase
MKQRTVPEPIILWFDQIELKDLPLVGGKNASLGEMVRTLESKGVPVPKGYAITTAAWRRLVESAGLQPVIEEHLRGLDASDVESLHGRGRSLREAILDAPFPEDVTAEITQAYLRLGEGREVDVAVRSSATAEDLPEASFAGQQETFLNIRGRRPLVEACRKCFASLFTDRAISYRAAHGIPSESVSLSIGIQKMVRSDLAASGVMFTIDTETGFRDAILINASYGLGESIVQGAVNPDEYVVFKPALKQGYRPILRKEKGGKETKIVYDIGGTKGVKTLPVPPEERARFALPEDDILTLARWGVLIEEHYSIKAGRPTPMDIEWAKDGVTGRLYILQARPETVQSRRRADLVETYRLEAPGKILARGRSVGGKIASGRVRVVRSLQAMGGFQGGEILVADKTDPDWEPIMKKAAAVVTNRGGRTCHAAIVSRELGVPAVVGAGDATSKLSTGQEATVSCAEGDEGFVYEGRVPFAVERAEISNLRKPRTKIMLNVANPDEAFRLSFIPNDGVGLAREEFIIANFVKIHPLALVHPERVPPGPERDEIERLTADYADKPRYFVDKLAEGIAMIAAAFYPKDVILRLSDFKTNEYAGLLGGSAFEPREDNPMLGWRGASRYAHSNYREGFALECQAAQKAREDMGLRNLKLMIPFCRTVEEGRSVLFEMARHGMKRGKDGLEVYVMCEIPSNVLLAERFAEIFDGFSIGSNDLTQLILGVDRDSELVAAIFDERNEAVKSMIAAAIAAAKKAGRKIGICGQAPSDYPDFAQFLVAEGIDSISLNPDAALRTMRSILDMERRIEMGSGAALAAGRDAGRGSHDGH